MALVGQADGQASAGIMWSNARGDNGRTACMAVDGLERDPEAKSEFVMTSTAGQHSFPMYITSTWLFVQPDGQVLTNIYTMGKYSVVGFNGNEMSTIIDDAMAVGLDIDGSIIYVDKTDGGSILKAKGNPALSLQLDDELIGDVLATKTGYVMVTWGPDEFRFTLWTVSRDGAVDWFRDLDAGYFPSASPAIDADGNIHLCLNHGSYYGSYNMAMGEVEDRSIYCIFRANGELRFREGLDQLYSMPISPVIGSDGVPYLLLFTANFVTIDENQYMAPNVTSVVAFKDGGDFKYKFDFKYEDGFVLLSEPAVDKDGRLYVVAQNIRLDPDDINFRETEGDASLWAISAAGRHRWNQTLDGPKDSMNGPIIDGHDNVYALSDDTIHAFRWYGGEMFTYQLPGHASWMAFDTDGDIWVSSIIAEDEAMFMGLGVTVTHLGEGEPWVYQNLVYMGMVIMLLPMMLVVVAALRTQD